MTDHLPECWLAEPCRSRNDGHENHDLLTTIAGVPAAVCEVCLDTCICTALRACEQRVIEGFLASETMKVIRSGESEHGFHAGLDAAREAVAALMITAMDWDYKSSASYGSIRDEARQDALAAIDTLKEGN